MYISKKILMIMALIATFGCSAQRSNNKQNNNNGQFTYNFINRSNDIAVITVEFDGKCHKERFKLADHETKQLTSNCKIKQLKVEDRKVPNLEGMPITAVHGVSGGPYENHEKTFIIEATIQHPTYKIVEEDLVDK